MRARSVAILALSIAACGGSGPVDEPVTVFVVRHAEQVESTDGDPPLSEEGRARARALAHVLAEARVDAVVVSNRRRSRQTAAPVVARTGAKVDELEREEVEEIAARIRAGLGASVLVVGHSDTVGPIVEALGGQAIGPIEEGDYDDLFVVRIEPDGTIVVEHLQYGEPTPVE